MRGDTLYVVLHDGHCPLTMSHFRDQQMCYSAGRIPLSPAGSRTTATTHTHIDLTNTPAFINQQLTGGVTFLPHWYKETSGSLDSVLSLIFKT